MKDQVANGDNILSEAGMRYDWESFVSPALREGDGDSAHVCGKNITYGLCPTIDIGEYSLVVTMIPPLSPPLSPAGRDSRGQKISCISPRALSLQCIVESLDQHSHIPPTFVE